jgi:hypothetical protein
LAERSLPFFTVLCGANKFEWGESQQQAFEELKEYLSSLTTLSSPEPNEPLLLYIAASNSAVSAVLVREGQQEASGKTKLIQTPVYFVSGALAGSKRFYSEVEKICYAVVMASRKLRHYFEAHRIKVLTSQSLRESSGRISKWALELSEHVVDFEKLSAIKSQVLADFVSDWTEPNSFDDGPIPDSIWTLHCDGAWGYAGARPPPF